MTKPESIALQVAKCAALLDAKVPGWAYRIPLGDVNVADVRKAPLAFVIGPHWDEVITSESAIKLGAFTVFTAEAEVANRAWRRQVSTRRIRHRQAS